PDAARQARAGGDDGGDEPRLGRPLLERLHAARGGARGREDRGAGGRPAQDRGARRGVTGIPPLPLTTAAELVDVDAAARAAARRAAREGPLMRGALELLAA